MDKMLKTLCVCAAIAIAIIPSSARAQVAGRKPLRIQHIHVRINDPAQVMQAAAWEPKKGSPVPSGPAMKVVPGIGKLPARR
jgi:hypothetical protein